MAIKFFSLKAKLPALIFLTRLTTQLAQLISSQLRWCCRKVHHYFTSIYFRLIGFPFLNIILSWLQRCFISIIIGFHRFMDFIHPIVELVRRSLNWVLNRFGWWELDGRACCCPPYFEGTIPTALDCTNSCQSFPIFRY